MEQKNIQRRISIKMKNKEVDIVLAEFKSSNKGCAGGYYVGNPYYVSGNALLHSVAGKLSYREKRRANFSHGIFLNMYKEFRKRYRTKKGHLVGKEIPDIKTYWDFFKLRRKPFPYTSYDEFRVPDIYDYDGRKIQKRRLLYFYVMNLDRDIKELFNGAIVGGARNYGFGELTVEDTKTINLNEIEPKTMTYDQKEGEKKLKKINELNNPTIELITPICLKSEVSGTENYDPPSFLHRPSGEYRTRKEIILSSREEKKLELIDSGQTFGFNGDSLTKTAYNGIQGIMNHKKYGYGEFLIR